MQEPMKALASNNKHLLPQTPKGRRHCKGPPWAVRFCRGPHVGVGAAADENSYRLGFGFQQFGCCLREVTSDLGGVQASPVFDIRMRLPLY